MYRGQAIAARTRYLKEVEYRAAGRNRDAAVLETNGAQQPTLAVSLAETKGNASQGLLPQDSSRLEGHTNGEGASARHRMMVRHIEGGTHSVQPNGDLLLCSMQSKKEPLSGPKAAQKQILQKLLGSLSDRHAQGSLPRYL
jgi:hypothetical protein